MLQSWAQYSLESLPASGSATATLSPGRHWPAYEDSINYRWAGAQSLSPAAKYGAAFGIGGIEDLVSNYHGIDQYKDGSTCSADSECDHLIGERCGFRSGKVQGYCIPANGRSQAAWAASALLLPGPQQPVTFDGTTFLVEDIRALLTLAHHEVEKVDAYDHCETKEANRRVDYDAETGARVSPCLGMGPGQMHLLLGNLSGIEGRRFVAQRDLERSGSQSLVQGYRVESLDEVSFEEGNVLLGIREGGIQDSQSSTLHRGAWQHLDPYTVEPGDEVTVQVSGAGDVDLYVRFDRQPTIHTYECRPYLEGSYESCHLRAPVGASKLYVSVTGNADITSAYTLEVLIGGQTPGEYGPNPDVVKLYKVVTEIDYLSPITAGGEVLFIEGEAEWIDNRSYEYLLEVDASDRILGGEWIGDAAQSAPSLFWLPVQRGTASVAGGAIQFRDIESLLRQSLGESSGRALTLRKSGTIEEDSWEHYGPFDALRGEFRAALSGHGGDADLYVRIGGEPDEKIFDCSPFRDDSNELCMLQGPGQFYVSVFGSESSVYELEIEYVGPGISL